MIPYQFTFIFLIVLMSVSGWSDEDDEIGRNECGQYGFRCVDERTIEFCPIPVDGVTDKPEKYECEEDYVCDVDNPAYCTPVEPPNKIIEEAMKHQDQHDQHGLGTLSFEVENYDDIYFDEEAYYKLNRVARSNRHDDECGCETTTTEAATTTTTTESPDEFSTVEYTPSPPFDCDSYGFFADKKNHTLFWYCDVPLDGHGFLLRHMMCGHDRYFDELLKNCVLRGTVRQERKNSLYDLDMMTKRARSALDCTNKKPGKYADEANCCVYHLCLPKQFSPAIQLTFMCPRGTAYDDTCKSCTIAAYNRCQSKEQKNTNKINCRSPTRFRSIEDCSGYFLCFVDNVIEIKCPKFYKFDDIALECLPEKVAECKEYSL